MAVALAGVGCGSEAPPAVPLCDGSPGLTLRVFLAGGGPIEDGSAVRLENGYDSFALDGQCQYFMSGTWYGSSQRLDEGWRQGVVDADLRRALERVVGVDDVSTINDCEGFTTVSDGGALYISNRRSGLVCLGSEGRRVRAVFDAIQTRAEKLWTLGKPLDQGLHVAAVDPSGVWGPPGPYPWPSELPLSDFFSSPSSGSYSDGSSKRVAAGDAAPLRALRERYLSDIRKAPNLYLGNGIPVRDGDVSARVYMRDELPYEDEHGLWPFPQPSD